MPSFTINQKKALDTQRNMIVSANAGSGKTAVFVARYVDLITRKDDPIPIQQIVAITFTEKAAGELKKKISERIEELVGIASSEERSRFKKIREQLVAANIFTIHAFCRKILTEYTVEAELDPSFNIIQGIEYDLLVEELIKKTLEEILTQEKNHRLYYPFLRVIEKLGRWNVFQLVELIFKKRELFHWLYLNVDALYQKDDEEIIQYWFDELTTYLNSFFVSPEGSRWIDVILVVSSYAKGKHVDDVHWLIDKIKYAKEVFERLSLFGDLCKVLVTKEGAFRKREFIGSKNDREEFDIAEEQIRYVFDALVPFIDLAKEKFFEDHRVLVEQTKTLLEVVHEIHVNIEEEKRMRAMLDFTDLQLKTWELLQKPEICLSIANDYRYIMVDEYQDTDALQYAIFTALTDNMSRNNFYAVGDDKQSIYRFRNAEVRIFSQTRSRILETQHNINTPLLCDDVLIDDANEDERRGVVDLPESFRLLKKNAAFVNLVFGQIMQSNPFNDASSNGSVHYNDFITAVEEPNAHLSGHVEILVAQNDDEGTDLFKEEELIARKILQLISNNHLIRCKKEKRLRQVRFGDIAILIRSRRTLPVIELALREHQIPFLITKGTGFYATQELWDIYHYLQFIILPSNDLALFGILRSPFFGISDAELFCITKERYTSSDLSLWQRVQIFVDEKREECSEESIRAVRILRNDLKIGERLPVPMFLEHILHQPESAGWIGVVSGTHRGDQAIANIHKMLDLARAFEMQGQRGLYDFTMELETYIRSEVEEAEGDVSLQDDVVHIMTIHAAKGLEFPVVFLCNLNKKFQYDHLSCFDRQLGYFWDTFSKNFEVEETSIAMKYLMQKHENRKTDEEEKRIFYVGATRASDMLFLSGRIEKKRLVRPSYASWLFDSLHIEPNDIKDEYQFDAELTVRKYDSGIETYEKESLNIVVPITKSVQLQSHADQKMEGLDSLPSFNLQPLKTHDGTFTISASQLMTFRSCERKYYLSYCLGLHQKLNAIENIFVGQDDVDEESGAELGTKVHETLAKILHVDDANNWLSKSAGSSPSLVEKHVRSFLNSDFGNWLLGLGKNPQSKMRTEVSLVSAVKNDFIVGTIDRLFLDDYNVWCFVDYKTNSIRDRSIDGFVDYYKPQMDLYAYLIWSAQHQPEVIKSFLFFTDGSEISVKEYSIDELRSHSFVLENNVAFIKEISSNRRKPGANFNHCSTCHFYNIDAEKCIMETTI